jgi:hypothetical protein
MVLSSAVQQQQPIQKVRQQPTQAAARLCLFAQQLSHAAAQLRHNKQQPLQQLPDCTSTSSSQYQQLLHCVSPGLEVRHACKHRLHALNDCVPLPPLHCSGPQCLQDKYIGNSRQLVHMSCCWLKRSQTATSSSAHTTHLLRQHPSGAYDGRLTASGHASRF